MANPKKEMQLFLEGQEHFSSRREGEALSEKRRLGGVGPGAALCLAESRAEKRSRSHVQSFPTSLRRFRQKSMQLRQKYRCVRSERQVWGKVSAV